MLIDTHCHLGHDDYENIKEVINNMDGIIIAAGTDDITNLEVVDLVDNYKNVYGVLGIHPEEIDKLNDNSFNIIEKNLNNPKIVGIGEIGLDYYWTKENKEQQKELLIKQLEIAKKYNKPVVIHSRDAIQDTYDILKQYKVKGVIHSFSSSLEMAKEFIKLGYKLGIGGVVTFKNGKNIQNIVENLGLENFVLETDSPYLSPEPFRGKKNEPKNVYYVAKKISEIKNINIDKVIEITNQNAINLFDLDI